MRREGGMWRVLSRWCRTREPRPPVADVMQIFSSVAEAIGTSLDYCVDWDVQLETLFNFRDSIKNAPFMLQYDGWWVVRWPALEVWRTRNDVNDVIVV